jgi:hypothetical protein
MLFDFFSVNSIPSIIMHGTLPVCVYIEGKIGFTIKREKKKDRSYNVEQRKPVFLMDERKKLKKNK